LVIKIPLHPDFQKVYDNFVSEYGAEKGKKLFYAYVNKHGYDDTKPMPSKKELRDSSVYGLEIKELQDSYVIGGIIATTHIDSVNDKIMKETLEKWAKEINDGSPRANKLSYHHDRTDPKVVGVGLKGSAKVITLPNNEYGLYVESELNKTHELFKDIVYEKEKGMIDSFSIEYDASKGSLFRELAGLEVRILTPETDLYGYTLASRPINEHAIMIKEIMTKEVKPMAEEVKEQAPVQAETVAAPAPIVEEKQDMMTCPECGKKVAKGKKCPECGAMMEKPAKKEDIVDTKTESKEIDVKEVVSKVLESKEFKEAVDNLKIENKVILNKEGERMVKIEEKEYMDALKNKETVSVDEQFKRAAKYADSRGLIQRFVVNKEAGRVAESREFKNFSTNGRKLEYKNLGVTTNQNTDIDYLLSAAELADVFDPVIYNALNEKANFFNVLAKDDYSQKGNNQVQFTLKTDVNTTAAAYTGNSIVTGNATRLKMQTKFKKYQAGIAVDGDMIAAAKGGPIGDVFAQEVKDATETLLSVINAALFGTAGAETAADVIGLSYISRAATYTTLYNLTRSVANKLTADTVGDTYINASSANVTLAQLRQAIRGCLKDGSNRNDLLIVCDPIQEDKIKELFDDQLRYMSPKESRFGFETQLYIDGVPVLTDKDCPDASIFVVDMAAHRLGIWVPPTLEMLGKRSDSEEGFVKTYLAVYNRAPRRLYEIYGLATT